ncbi:NERD domain-containing protein [Psychrobacillus sp. BL-248-WT-3]|uniref:NERD domain-containing protein n=1 Tax=Psychrobacillus sp. BL-248-WT-3 TaxID=2725306 RepID=UPI00146F371E|nr:NERD domain-containing protein [Psychrobacillus sp. BL-248-WT-3]NME06353.1 NERD domain-containing protein [Psychrobacillus sp. BL-248-WT-3]
MGIIILVLFIFFLVILKKPTVKGSIGEWQVKRKLMGLDEEEYVVLHDLLLPYEEGTTQIDHVVVSTVGIFVIETKNYKGWIFGKERQKYWKQVIYKKNYNFLNPVMQNFAHLTAIQALIKEMYEGPYYSLIAFSNEATFKNIEITSDHVRVLYISDLFKTIKSYEQKVILPYRVRQIAKLLINENIQGKETRKIHVQEIKTKLVANQINLNTEICPRCSGHLITRKGKYGDFKGCSNFPKCRYVLK